jgi:radical SAM superfamily enzyme YgiQ (UPF0313 family)
MVNARNVSEGKAKLLKQMNCVSASIGIETGNLKLRKEVLKRTETPEDIIKAVHILNDCDIRTSSFNMLGIPFESRETLMETIELNIKSGVQHPNTVFFYPLEKTDLRDISIRHGFIQDNTYYNFNDKIPTLKFKDLSTEELIAIRERFALYVKLPRNLHPFIRRSEVTDVTGNILTNELFCIYENYINNGENDTHQRLVTELKNLWSE